VSYLGNIPAEAYSTISYQDLTGGSGTSFTLDYSVGSPNEIEVFVNNVRQEPSVAYTVAGTALTMTGSIVATDDFYIVFQGKAQQTATHPSNQNLNAIDGTFTGTVEISGNVPIWENSQTVNADYTITDGRNAMSAGPITVASGVTVTVGSGETWTVV
jgi:hypothetical protein